mmetsp:Transcript_25097/g.39108  ORF Transcript_25097/g.39108 Transcript_25097/m.39108 type:complete len:534 (-) Transcript_25097:45-1646(-)|eukprot:CAMPEP_0201524932 /NCGR_PEP_ID=MMETSP0161_2-20130828/25890_1 /ASSEMBLY_ACC=CAM_ASM_000251 /TAXON_ID=180227 /ORGANISM="Neoparamoeba aestuarina, Strain SoJaBio B1-5/56/2" /LENGTH=533 /DNA_ID=CAMNT_0047924587 /DNA_START=60 /DNA_END=1661 /DNA_ORIENTATION=-
MKGCVVLLVVALVGIVVGDVVVTTANGQISGSEDSEGIYSFKGVPYAQNPPPRFAPPEPPQDWDDVLDCTEYRDICLQNPNPSLNSTYRPTPSTSNCLWANVWSSNISSDANMPVMFFIHGGGYYSGAGSDLLYDGSRLASQGVVVVTINYRLGALGFLNDPSSQIYGNMGIKDQQLGLKWTQQNIKNFGGDPTRVTLFGQSAGGISVSVHLTTPSSFGLFSTVIVHSSPPIVGLQTQNGSEFFADQFAAAANCAKGDRDCLLNLSDQQVLDAQNKVGPDLSYKPLVPQYLLPWMPVIDNDFIVGSPLDLLIAGKYSPHTAIIWGSNRNDTSGWIEEYKPFLPVLPPEYNIYCRLFFGDNAEAVEQQYPAHRPSQTRIQMAATSTDWMFTCSIRNIMRRLYAQEAPISRYIFQHQPSSDPVYHDSVSPCGGDGLGDVCHGEELISVWHTAAISGASFTSDEETFSRQMASYWLTAAKNPGKIPSPWPAYSPADDLSVSFDLGNIEEIEYFEAANCDFWDSLGYYNAATQIPSQ